MDLFTQIDKNRRRSIFLIIAFIGFITFMGAALGTALGLTAEEWASSVIFALVISSFSAFFSYYFSHKIVLKISGAKEITRENGEELYRILENLCMAAGLPMPKLYYMEDTAPNAFATGRNPENAVICITSGLVQKLERSEIEGVLAHELAHVGNRDILFMSLVTVLVGTTSLLSDLFFRASRLGGSKKKDSKDSGNAQLIIFLIGIVFAILAPIVATVIKMAISRKREFLADATGASISRNPEALARALHKISADPEPLEASNSATAHLYISNPLKGRGISELFRSHPPTKERIKALNAMVGKF